MDHQGRLLLSRAHAGGGSSRHGKDSKGVLQRLITRIPLLMALLVLGGMAGCAQTLRVIQTASTNHPGMQVTVTGSLTTMIFRDKAVALPYSSQKRKILWQAVQHAGPLAGLPVSHCMKSASFGYQLFLEANGQRSPDLSCGNQTDSRAAALHEQAEKILTAARTRLASHGDSWK